MALFVWFLFTGSELQQKRSCLCCPCIPPNGTHTHACRTHTVNSAAVRPSSHYTIGSSSSSSPVWFLHLFPLVAPLTWNIKVFKQRKQSGDERIFALVGLNIWLMFLLNLFIFHVCGQITLSLKQSQLKLKINKYINDFKQILTRNDK